MIAGPEQKKSSGWGWVFENLAWLGCPGCFVGRIPFYMVSKILGMELGYQEKQYCFYIR